MGARPPTTSTAASGTTGARVVLPGQLYALLRLGRDGRRDPARARRAPRRRRATPCPYADLRAVDLLWTVDALVAAAPRAARPARAAAGPAGRPHGGQRRRRRPRRSGAAPAAEAADVLDQLGAAGRAPGARCGPSRAPRGRSARRARCRGCAPGTAPARGRSCGWRPSAGATVVDGSAEALAGLAALGALPRPAASPTRATSRAPSSGAPRTARGRDHRLQPPPRPRGRPDGAEPRRDARRRRAVLPGRRGARPVPGARRRRADRRGLRRRAAYLRMPFSPAYSQFPERRPFAAFDGDPATHWQADRALEPAPALARDRLRRAARRRLDRAAAVLRPPREGDGGGGRRPHVPRASRAGTGSSSACAASRSLRVRIARVAAPTDVPDGRGRHPRAAHPRRARAETLRPPVLAERALRRPRSRPHRADLPVRAHDGRRPVPPRPAARHRRRGAGARPPGRRARHRALDLAARGAVVGGGRLGDGRLAGDRPGDRRAGRRPRRSVRLLGALRGPAGVPRLERVRRRSAALDRLLARRAHRLAVVDGARAGDAAGAAARAGPRAGAPPDARAGAQRRRGDAPRRRRRERARGAPRAGPRALVPAGDPALRVPRGRLRGRAPAPRRRRSARSAEPACRAPGCRGPARSGAAAATSRPRSGTGRCACAPPGRSPTSTRAAHCASARAGRRRTCPRGGRGSPCPRPRSRRTSCGCARPRRSLPPRPRPPAACSTPAAPGATGGRASGSTCASPPGWCSSEAYSAAWRARCDGRDLGAPVPVDGFAMGWRVPAGCRAAEMGFAPDSARARGLPRLAARACWRCSGAARVPPPAPRAAEPASELPEPAARPMPAAPCRGARAGRGRRARLRVRGPRRAADRARDVRDPVARDRRPRR